MKAARWGGFFFNWMKNDPIHRITPRAVKAWKWSAALRNLLWFLLPAAWVTAYDLDTTLSRFMVLLLFAVALLFWIAGVFCLPGLRWKRWRYSIDRNEIDLKRGIWIVRRTLIPLSRVQHVDTRQGPLLRYWRLASVTISTAATTHEIPALDEERADRVRDIISTYARLAGEDV